MRKISLSAAAAAVLLLTFAVLAPGHAAPASPPSDSASKYEVSIDNFSFSPAVLSVPVGATVTWTNRDDVPHTVVSTNQAFPHSPALETDQSFTYAFAQSGTYEYYCSVHPKMVGKIVVR